MNASRFAARLAAVALALAVGSGCGGTAPPTVDAASRPKASGVATPALKVGDPLPPLAAEGWVNGPPPAPGGPGVRLLVVDMWGRWCPVCEQTAPALARTHQKYAAQGVAFASVTNHDRELVEHYASKHSVTWPSGYGATAGAVAALGAGSGMIGPADYEVAPTLYLVGPDGVIRWVDGRGRMRHQNPAAWEQMVDTAIAAALAPPPPKP